MRYKVRGKRNDTLDAKGEKTPTVSILNTHISILLCSCFFIFASCQEPQKKKDVIINAQKLKEDIVKVNIPPVIMEQDEINAYIKAHGYKMQSTGSGLRYMFINKSEGKGEIKTGNIIKINYKVWLLDGTLCYSSDVRGSKNFAVGADNVESGVHEGVKLMKEGEKALFILPSHLAFGLIGDRVKIPPKSAVVYEIEVIEVK